MTMPKWHQTMRPTLEALAAAPGILTTADVRAVQIKAFSMTEEEAAERLSSGQLRLSNRLGWGITDLAKAGLIEHGEKSGTYRITDAGRTFLAQYEGPITARTLYDNCPPFKKWKDGYRAAKKQGGKNGATADPDDDSQASPQESMEAANKQLRDALAGDLISAIMGKDPFFFEHLVGRVLVAMGYGESPEAKATVTQKSADEGIDGIVKEDRLGFGAIYYQAKRWDPKRTVGRPDVQAFVGAISGKGASKGLFITTASFSQEARSYAESLHAQKVVLIDGATLANLMIDYNVGVSTRTVYEVKALDTDFFEDE